MIGGQVDHARLLRTCIIVSLLLKSNCAAVALFCLPLKLRYSSSLQVNTRPVVEYNDGTKQMMAAAPRRELIYFTMAKSRSFD